MIFTISLVRPAFSSLDIYLCTPTDKLLIAGKNGTTSFAPKPQQPDASTSAAVRREGAESNSSSAVEMND